MNKANKSIGWTGYTWNPIKGICPVGCWYCYARKIYKRFGFMEKYAANPYLDRDFVIGEDTIFISDYEANQPYVTRVEAKREVKPRKIFVCSTIEIFHPKIPKSFRDDIFNTISGCPQDTFQILTKMPENIDRPMPDNVWLGCTLTGEKNEELFEKGFDLNLAKARTKFISFEPLLQSIDFDFLDELCLFDWIIIGRLTGYGHKYDPPRGGIVNIVYKAKQTGIPIFLKDNLKEIWDERLIQEFPKE